MSDKTYPTTRTSQHGMSELSEVSEKQEQAQLPDEMLHWQQRLAMVGIQLIDVAYDNLPLWGSRSFKPSEAHESEQDGLNALWAEQRQRISSEQPVVIIKVDSSPQSGLFVGCLVAELSDGSQALLACHVAPPFDEKTVSTIQLSLGWLYYYFAEDNKAQGDRAKKLMALFSHVLSQTELREAAQEWVNRTAVWAREVAQSDDEDMSLLLFQVKGGTPKWWVSSGVAWVERGSPVMQHASELAARAMVEVQEQTEHRWWAFPLMTKGDVSSVLVLHQDEHTKAVSEPVKDILRASATMAEPVLRHWEKSEQPLWKHGKRSSTSLLEKFFGPGHLTWKVFGSLGLFCLLLITVYPVDDIVNANLYVEGDSRWIVTAPQQGFLASVAVRPGDQVMQGDVLATLEDNDLKLEAAELQSEIDQADGRFRRAMAADDAAESGLATNQKQQAQTRLAVVTEKLKRVRITAPMTGQVVSGDWSQQIGAPVESGKELFQLAEDKTYRLVLHVLDRDIDEVRLKQEGKLRLTSLPDETYDFEVSRITSVATVDDGNNGFQVEAKLMDTDIRLNPGMQGIGKVTVGRTNLISLWTASFIDWLRLKVWSIW